MIRNIPENDDFEQMIRTCFAGDSGCPSREPYFRTGLTYQQWRAIRNILNEENFDMPRERMILTYHGIINWIQLNERSYPEVNKRLVEFNYPLYGEPVLGK